MDWGQLILKCVCSGIAYVKITLIFKNTNSFCPEIPPLLGIDVMIVEQNISFGSTADYIIG